MRIPPLTWTALRGLYVLLITASSSTIATAANDYQPYTIPSPYPSSYEEVLQVVSDGNRGSNNPNINIPLNLEQAMCGGWDFDTELNGSYLKLEFSCPNPDTAPVKTECRDEEGNIWTKTSLKKWKNLYTEEETSIDPACFGIGGLDPIPEQYTCQDNWGNNWIFLGYGEWEDEEGNIRTDDEMVNDMQYTDSGSGLIPRATGVPGREIESTLGNVLSGMATRKNVNGSVNDIIVNGLTGLREIDEESNSGFNFPSDPETTCGFVTVCRPLVGDRIADPDDLQGTADTGLNYIGENNIFCSHPCQRPLGIPGKPAGWSTADSTASHCTEQEANNPEDGIRYTCGGGETIGPEQGNICENLKANGLKGGLCEDLNNWVYVLWTKSEEVCDGTFITRYKKGKCGFPSEVVASEETIQLQQNEWKPLGLYECCSDTEFGSFDEDASYERGRIGESCKICDGDNCRLFDMNDDNVGDAKVVILSDEWYEGPPGGLPPGCLPPPGAKQKEVGLREYISYFREYSNAGYERAQFTGTNASGKPITPDDDHAKQNIPVACYGLYNEAPEDALRAQTREEMKRCVIAAYYTGDDGDGDEANFWRMKNTQKGKGAYNTDEEYEELEMPERNNEGDLWKQELGSAFSMINEEKFETLFGSGLTFLLLSTDTAKQRATVQISENQPLSSGALLRSTDDTVTIEEDPRSDRRTMVEWWHHAETAMNQQFSGPLVRLLLPSPWSADINPLDRFYTRLPEREEPLAADIREERIEVQVQAREDLLGEIAGFLERVLLLRVREEPVPIVVPIVNPIQIRAFAQGWETWALDRDARGLPGGSQGREVANRLQEYADRADEVRALRGVLPRMIQNILVQQETVILSIKEWLEENLAAYEEYRASRSAMATLQSQWNAIQKLYRETHDIDGYPWCRNDRYTVPIYSLLDPWLPGREIDGDVSGGFAEHELAMSCATQIYNADLETCANPEGTGEEEYIDGSTCFSSVAPACQRINDYDPLVGAYVRCAKGVTEFHAKEPEYWTTLDVCDRFYPIPPRFPALPTPPAPDLVLDFTAFQELENSIAIPVLKPVQIRVDFENIRPPETETKDTPEFPDLPPLPEMPMDLLEEIADTLPAVFDPSINRTIQEEIQNQSNNTTYETMQFRHPSILNAYGRNNGSIRFPQIAMPQADLIIMESFLSGAEEIVSGMAEEYKLFWQSLVQEPCGEEPCIKPGTEQDCLEPHADPNERCVHFEGDLMERFIRIGARPAVQIKEDFLSIGPSLRRPLIHGQQYCEREDWACQLLNRMQTEEREGWLLEELTSDTYSQEGLLYRIQEAIREATDNAQQQGFDDSFIYDAPQEHMFENFRVPQDTTNRLHSPSSSSSSSIALPPPISTDS